MNSFYIPLAAILTAGLGAASAHAGSFTTTDLSSYVNANIFLNPQTVPIGTTTGNQGTDIRFDLATYNGLAGSWIALSSASGVLNVHLAVSGEASFYALLNNYFGTPGADEYDVTLKATNGDSVTYPSIGGVDTRDYNANIFTNTIAHATFPWFNNGIGQRLDVREFNLPSSFAKETISDFIITQRVPTDPAVLSGLTFSTTSYAPEPVSFALSAAGLMAVTLLGLRRRALTTRSRIPGGQF
ncbi:MAG: hypothetical protein M3Y72_18730 [Acidobacteriota bacterium]|nr:hypothetical protein [Acidobacteriota bacterium]